MLGATATRLRIAPTVAASRPTLDDRPFKRAPRARREPGPACFAVNWWLVVFVALLATTRSAFDMHDDDDESDDDNVDYDFLDDDNHSFDGNALEFFVALEREQGSSSAAGAELGHAVAAAKRVKHAGGRPASVEVDESEFERMCLEGCTERELVDHFECDRNRVNYLKRKLGLQGLRAQRKALVAMPTAEELERAWLADRGADSLHRLPVSKAVVQLATELDLSVNALRRHMRAVGFSPTHPYTLEQVKEALESLYTDACCNSFGVTFAESSLRTDFGMVVRRSQIRQALRELDPEGHRKRAKEAAKTMNRGELVILYE